MEPRITITTEDIQELGRLSPQSFTLLENIALKRMLGTQAPKAPASKNAGQPAPVPNKKRKK